MAEDMVNAAPAAAIKERLRSGLSGEAVVEVNEQNTAQALGSGSVAEVSASVMIGVSAGFTLL